MNRGKLIVLSGPSGSGKSTVIDRLLDEGGIDLTVSPSMTTRPPRGDDQHAKSYIHVTAQAFEAARNAGTLIEWAEVSGHWYGTPRGPVEGTLDGGKSVLLEIDVQGGMAIRKLFPDCVLVFLKARSLEDYENRIRRRGTNSEEEIQRRIAVARRELEFASQYDYQIVNDNLDEAVQQIREILSRIGGIGSA